MNGEEECEYKEPELEDEVERGPMYRGDSDPAELLSSSSTGSNTSGRVSQSKSCGNNTASFPAVLPRKLAELTDARAAANLPWTAVSSKLWCFDGVVVLNPGSKVVVVVSGRELVGWEGGPWLTCQDVSVLPWVPGLTLFDDRSLTLTLPLVLTMRTTSSDE